MATEPSAVLFAQGRFLVRVLADRASDLPRRVAVSVANRIGVHEPAPHLVSRFPGRGLEPQSVRYFLGPESLGAYAYSGTVKRIELPPDVEVAQARYRIDGAEGTLALVGFPTSQLAQDYYERLFQARLDDAGEHGTRHTHRGFFAALSHLADGDDVGAELEIAQRGPI